MDALRTPDARFESLPDFPFAPRYVDVPSGDGGTLRMAYVDEGPASAPVVLMLHGEPTWSFMYRALVARVRDAGMRAVAPDLVGFGRSDKPTAREAFRYAAHMGWLRAFVDALSLREIALVCHDWGGLLGLRMVGESPERFARVVATNTFLPTGEQKVSDAFFAWREFSQSTPVFPAGRIVAGGCARPLSAPVIAAYDAPFPDEAHKAGARQFPVLVPVTADDPGAVANRAAWKGLERFERPFLTLFGDSDPITKGADKVLAERIPGAKGQPHAVLEDVGHFSMEDAPDEMSARIVAFLGAR